MTLGKLGVVTSYTPLANYLILSVEGKKIALAMSLAVCRQFEAHTRERDVAHQIVYMFCPANKGRGHSKLDYVHQVGLIDRRKSGDSSKIPLRVINSQSCKSSRSGPFLSPLTTTLTTRSRGARIRSCDSGVPT